MSAAQLPWGDERSKTVTWHDPLVGARAMTQMSGIDYLRAIADGSLPPAPIAQLFGARVSSIREGEVVFHCVPDESAYNPIGAVHGGFMCTLLDSVVGCAVQTTLPAGTGYTSLEIKVSYLRAVRAGEELTAVGRVTKPGRRAAFADGEIRDAQDRLVATASTTCLVFPLPAPA